MDILTTLLALCFLMFVAYRGFSVILFAPVAALFAVVCVNPALVPPFFSGIYMEKLAGFLKPYFPVFLLGAIFGKLIEISGFARAITERVTGVIGNKNAMLAVVVVCALLTYGGVSLFVAAFAVYPFALELFKAANIPKRLIPGTIALGSFTFTMDALPGSPQIQNIIPTGFFKTNTWAAPWLGLIGALFVFACGMSYLGYRRRQAQARGEGFNPEDAAPAAADDKPAHPLVAFLPLVLVGVVNLVFTRLLPKAYGPTFDFAAAGVKDVAAIDTSKVFAIWAVEGALLVGIGAILVTAFARVRGPFSKAASIAVAGALLAAFNTASEYGFGGVIAALPGFRAISGAMTQAIGNPLLNAAISTTTLAGITGSASGGMSIALAAMGQRYLEQAAQMGIPAEVLHRVTAMASGGMDTLPHNGAVITLLAVTGLTHRQSYGDIFAMTLIKTAAVFVVIAFYYTFRIY
ncbi:GntP family permease [Polyangium aurulentum]|uniref:GntP family permease n=1 Tax=Polyangium aurulentum TaxID=2567896 RepID=UPI00146F82FA|nr:GntP family permease [Polyangium aurulentum]UQA56721.1 GntP family permease [Polyangium aurulentum]